VDILNETGKHPNLIADFKGNMDIAALKNFIEEKGAANIPLCMMTVTNNSGGGQPVSMANIRQTKKVLQKHGIPLFMTPADFAENAYFIKLREKGYSKSRFVKLRAKCFPRPTAVL